MKVVLISTYDLGRQPFGLASPAGWLRREGVEVTCQDLAVHPLEEESVRVADLVAFYVPMHTATRIAVQTMKHVRSLNTNAHICFYGLYATVNAEYLSGLGVQTLLGGEFERDLVRQLDSKSHVNFSGETRVSLERLAFVVPDRRDLPGLDSYAKLDLGDGNKRVVGYTEASRGCKHLCRHCPVVPVYKGAFRVVQRDIIMKDIGKQVEQGARHITFGDPDFFNGIRHALGLVQEMNVEYPDLTYDVTIKVEHLLKYTEDLAVLRDTGCAFVTSAVEAIDNRVLDIFDKGHTREDFVRVVECFKEKGLVLNPTFVTFTPWTTLDSYRDLLSFLMELDLVDHVSPVQLAIRLLIPSGSRLLELGEVREVLGFFDSSLLSWTWRNKDDRVDALHKNVLEIVRVGEETGLGRREVFTEVWKAVHRAEGIGDEKIPELPLRPSLAKVPFLTEPWYC